MTIKGRPTPYGQIG